MKALKSLLTNRYITCIIVVCGLKVSKLGSISKNLKVTLCGFKLEDEFCEIPKNTFFTEHLQWLLLKPFKSLHISITNLHSTKM